VKQQQLSHSSVSVACLFSVGTVVLDKQLEPISTTLDYLPQSPCLDCKLKFRGRKNGFAFSVEGQLEFSIQQSPLPSISHSNNRLGKVSVPFKWKLNEKHLNKPRNLAISPKRLLLLIHRNSHSIKFQLFLRAKKEKLEIVFQWQMSRAFGNNPLDLEDLLRQMKPYSGLKL
jgi:hypothetical protein